jgi:hypothetical protein
VSGFSLLSYFFRFHFIRDLELGSSATMVPSTVHEEVQLPQHSREIAAKVLAWIHYFSPAILLVFFLIAFIVQSVLASSPTNTKNNLQNGNGNGFQPVYGPGGRPLPPRRSTGLKRKQAKESDFPRPRKLLFQCVAIAGTLTFFASAIVIIIHVLTSHERYWCGEQLVVSKKD